MAANGRGRRASATVPRLATAEVVGRRLARHHLTDPIDPGRVTDLAAELCGIHAQVMSCAEISTGIRLTTGTRDVLRDALWTERSLVKTYGLRGTIHLFPANEIGMWLAALRAKRDPRGTSAAERTGLVPRQLAAIVGAIGDALDGRALTREQLGEEVAKRVGRWALRDGQPAFGGHFPLWEAGLRVAALDAVLCFGPNEGNRVTLVRLDQWVTAGRPPEGADALREVLRRFLRAYGPASPAEFAQWFYMPAPDARALVESIRDELAEVELEIDGKRRFVMAADLPWEGPSPRSVHLLSQFDVYCVGGHPRDLIAPPDVVARTQVERGPSANVRALLVGPLAVLLIDGVIAGVWSRQRGSGGRLDLRVEPYGHLTASQRDELEERARRVGEIVGATTGLSMDRVAVRPHL
jgi:hypothetical protein